MTARLISVSVPAKDVKRASSYYSALLGQAFGRVIAPNYEGYYAWASSGVKFTTQAAYGPSDEVMLNFAVPDLAAELQRVTASGGRVLQDDIALTVAPSELEALSSRFESLGLGSADQVDARMGTSAVIIDCEGNRMLLTQLAPYAEAFFEGGEVTAHERRQHRAGLDLGASAAARSRQ